MMLARCFLVMTIIGVGLTGCQSTQTTMAPVSEQSVVDRERAVSGSDVSAVFSTVTLASLLGERGLAPGFSLDDWEYGRRDLRLPAGYLPAAPTYGSFLIVDRETLYETNGRIRTNGRRTTYSIRGGHVR